MRITDKDGNVLAEDGFDLPKTVGGTDNYIDLPNSFDMVEGETYFMEILDNKSGEVLLHSQMTAGKGPDGSIGYNSGVKPEPLMVTVRVLDQRRTVVAEWEHWWTTDQGDTMQIQTPPEVEQLLVKGKTYYMELLNPQGVVTKKLTLRL